MTFSDIVSMVQGRLNLNSTESTTRVGTVVNARYQRLLAELGLDIHTQVFGVSSGAATIGSPLFTFTGIEKLHRVYYLSGSTPIFLEEIPMDEMRKLASTASGDVPSQYAVQAMVASSVTIRTNMNAATTYMLKADGLDTTDALAGSNVPALPTNFHYLLVEGAISDELMKMEKPQLANIAESIYSRGLSNLKLFVLKTGQSQRFMGNANIGGPDVRRGIQ